MDTTVTGMFSNARLANQAAGKLVTAGIRVDQIRIVDRHSPSRHQFIADRSASAKRGVLLGLVSGAIGGALAGAAIGGVFGFVQAILVGAIATAAGGAILGLMIGRSTASQVKDEVEHQVDGGIVLVSVTVDAEQKPLLMELLTKHGMSSLVSTAASFTGGVVPATPT